MELLEEAGAILQRSRRMGPIDSGSSQATHQGFCLYWECRLAFESDCDPGVLPDVLALEKLPENPVFPLCLAGVWAALCAWRNQPNPELERYAANFIYKLKRKKRSGLFSLISFGLCCRALLEGMSPEILLSVWGSEYAGHDSWYKHLGDIGVGVLQKISPLTGAFNGELESFNKLADRSLNGSSVDIMHFLDDFAEKVWY